MNFGVLLDHQYARDEDVAGSVASLVDYVEALRDLGFDSVFGIHHYLSGLRTLQPMSLLSRLVDRSGEMQLGTGILILPLLHPVHVAEEVATLDQLSGGRFVLGIGSGYRKEEFEAFGLKRSDRTARLVESLEVMTKLWTGEPVTHDGEHFQLEDASLSMLPAQRPHPPIWIGANSPEGIARAARLGHPWFAPANVKRNWAVGNLQTYREELVAAGFADEGRTYPIQRDLCIADSREEAFALVEPYVRASYGAYSKYGMDYFDEMFEEFKEKSFFFGTADDVAARIEDFARAGFNHFVFRTQWLGCPPSVSLGIAQRFAHEVMPRFRVDGGQNGRAGDNRTDNVRLGHVVLPVADLERALGFVEEALGLPLRFRDGDRYAALDAGGGTLALATPIEHVVSGVPSIGLKVTDLGAASERLRGTSATILGEIVETDHDRRLAFSDPDGNVFVLTESRPPAG